LLESFEEGAAAVAGRIEQANKLYSAALAGGLADPANLASEIDVLLDLFEKLDQAKRYEEELRVARALHGMLLLALRWLDLVRMLRKALRAARDADDAAGQAWALHELGSLQLCAGQPDAAAKRFREALQLEEQIGDAAGRCATHHNLDCARRDLNPGPRLPTWKRALRMAGVVGVIAAITVGSAIATGPDGNDDSSPSPSPSSEVSLAIRIVGNGNGHVTDPEIGINCRPQCSAVLHEATRVVLTATAGRRSNFEGWEGGACAGRENPCRLRMTSDTAVEARFTLKSAAQPPPGEPPAVEPPAAESEPEPPAVPDQPPTISPETLEFEVPAGTESDPQTVTVTAGSDAVTVTSVGLSEDSDFRIVNDGCAETALEPGTSCQVDVSFKAPDCGSYSVVLQVGLESGLTLSTGLNGKGPDCPD
jgi:hypothetical protein